MTTLNQARHPICDVPRCGRHAPWIETVDWKQNTDWRTGLSVPAGPVAYDLCDQHRDERIAWAAGSDRIRGHRIEARSLEEEGIAS